MRRFSNLGGPKTGLAENVAVVMRALVSALLRGGIIGIIDPPSAAIEQRAQRLPSEQPFYQPRPAKPASQQPRVEAEVAYVMQLVSRDQPLVNGVALSLDGRVYGALHLFGGYRFLTPIRAEVGGIKLELPLNALRYTVHDGDGLHMVQDAWIAQPFALLGVTLRLR